MKNFFCLLAFVYWLLFIVPFVRAEYVFPYPSYMPGNKLYKVSKIMDAFKEYWHWGSIASFKYHLALADKYLIEAKTLFEYKQYLLAVDALKRSNLHAEKIPVFIKRAKAEKKDVRTIQHIAEEALAAHSKLLDDIGQRVPDEFEWAPEKSASQNLRLGKLLREAMNLRQTVGEIITTL